jgi:hypothetical protein
MKGTRTGCLHQREDLTLQHVTPPPGHGAVWERWGCKCGAVSSSVSLPCYSWYVPHPEHGKFRVLEED